MKSKLMLNLLSAKLFLVVRIFGLRGRFADSATKYNGVDRMISNKQYIVENSI